MIPPGMLNNLFGNSVKESVVLSVLMLSFRDIFSWINAFVSKLCLTIKNKIRNVFFLDFALFWIFSILYFVYVKVPLYILGCVTSVAYIIFEFLRRRSNLFCNLSTQISDLERLGDDFFSKLMSCTFYDIYFSISDLIRKASIFLYFQ